MKKDKRKPGARIELRRSEMIYDVVRLLNNKAITMNDLDDFSDEFREWVRFLIEKGYGK